MADVVAPVMRNSFALNDAHDFPKNMRCRDARPDDFACALDSAQQGVMKAPGVRGRIAQCCDASNVGAVVAKSATAGKAYDLAGAQLAI